MIITYFGSPGCGKTTFAVKLMRRERRRISFANFEHTVPGARVCDLKGLGEWTFPLDLCCILTKLASSIITASLNLFRKRLLSGLSSTGTTELRKFTFTPKVGKIWTLPFAGCPSSYGTSASLDLSA